MTSLEALLNKIHDALSRVDEASKALAPVRVARESTDAVLATAVEQTRISRAAGAELATALIEYFGSGTTHTIAAALSAHAFTAARQDLEVEEIHPSDYGDQENLDLVLKRLLAPVETARTEILNSPPIDSLDGLVGRVRGGAFFAGTQLAASAQRNCSGSFGSIHRMFEAAATEAFNLLRKSASEDVELLAEPEQPA